MFIKIMEKGECLKVNDLLFRSMARFNYYSIRSVFFLCSWICFGKPISAQLAPADSLEVMIRTMKEDTAKVNRLNELVSKLQFANPAKAAVTAKEAFILAEKMNYTLGKATALRLQGVLYADRIMLDSCKFFYDQAWALAKDSKDILMKRQLAHLTHNYGVIYHRKQQFDSATLQYTAAARLYEETGIGGMTYFPYNNLSTIYSFFKDNEKALLYARASYEAAKKLNDPNKIAGAVNSIIAYKLELKQYDSILLPLRQNLSLLGGLQNNYQHAVANNLLAQYYGYAKLQYDSAVYYDKIALTYIRKANNPYDEISYLQNTGYYYKQAGKYDSAFYYLHLSLTKAREMEMDDVEKYSLANLVELEESRGNIAAAFRHLKDYVTVNDSLQEKNNRAQVQELEARYQTEKKEAEISRLNAERHIQKLTIQRKNMWNYLLVAAALVLGTVILLVYKNARHKSALQQKQIDELEREKKLAATEAVLKGEEQERSRLAKDLHDGLGGMLSGIKYSLNTMKGNLIMTPENAQAFERSIDMLDSSIKEMRRVAHNMMPEALVKFGLDTALSDFCTDINQSGALRVSYQSLGLAAAQFDPTTAITVYRVVQELVNNAIKHASAASLIVQVSKADDLLTITVEDDGKGFDPLILQRAKGIGWSNIQSRVEYLKGKMDVQSAPGKGTSVHIEIKA